MKILTFGIGCLAALSVVLSSFETASAANYYYANGGAYWTQSGSSWNKRYNDGYCVSGRGPCGSSLWYFQWVYNYTGCGYGNFGHWSFSTVVPYYGKISAWIDGYMGGTMTAANYSASYAGGSGYNVSINQNAYYEAFAPVAYLYKPAHLTLTDSWGPGYTCNSYGGKRVEFDEIKLDI